MGFSLSNLPDECRHIAFDTVGSTNSVALDHAARGDAGFLWISARRQTAGRGRRGRAWSSDGDNLYASLLICEPSNADRDYGNLPLVAAVALHDTIVRTAGDFDGRLAIKWPNDILIGGAKLAGMLLEHHALEDGRSALVIGIGVNCLADPDPRQVERQATSLKAEGVPVLPSDLLETLSERMLHWLRVWNLGAGLPAVLAVWTERAVGIGKSARVRLPQEEVTGRFEEIASDGALVLRTSDGQLRRVLAGDVFFADGDKHA